MIIDFRGNTGGSGSGGTTNYNELSNKPQINSVTLSGNVTTEDLGIISESLEPVSSIPSGASAGEIYTINKSETVAYGWEEIENGYAFNCSLNPASGDTPVLIGNFVGAYTGSSVYMYSDGHIDAFGDSIKIGFVKQNEWQLHPDPIGQSYVTTNYYNYNRIEFTFTDGRPGLTDDISRSETSSEIKAVQVAGVNMPIAHWELLDKYSDRYGQIQCWINENGKKVLTPNTELGLFRYYEAYFKLYTNNDGYFCVDYSSDSAVTWNHYISNANIPVSEPEYYPIDVTDPNGKNVLLKAWFKAGDDNYGLIIKANKSLWIENIVTPTGIIPANILKEGASYESLSELPQINGHELKGNKTTDDLGIAVNGLTNPDTYPQTLIATDGTDIAGKRGGFVIYGWDGVSDMTFSAEASRATGSWGPYSFNTPYFSGGTWYGLSDMRSSEVKFRVLPGNVIYLYGRKEQQSWGQPVYQFTGNISGSVGDLKMFYIDDVVQGSDAEVRIFRIPKVQHCGFSLNDFRGDGTITFSANTGDVIALDIASNEITGATFNGDSFSEGQEMTLMSGLDYFCYHGTQGYLVICDGDYNYQGNEAFVDYFTDVDVPLNESDEPIATVYFNEKYVYDDGAYQWNGCLWDKLVKENELPAPAAGGVQTHWVPYTDSQTYAMEGKCSYVRGDIVSNGDYYCNVGQIDGEQKALWATISNGAITGVGGQLYSNEINGHYYITVKDSSENTYGAQCWVDNGKLYWQVYGTTIVHLDNNELGANWEAGFIY